MKLKQPDINGLLKKSHNLWDELEIHINTFFENKSLKDLLNNNKETRV